MPYPCKCCGNNTLPVPPEDAIAYICPVCWWENDVFTQSDDEPSDENRGISINQARQNYKDCGLFSPDFTPPEHLKWKEGDPLP